MGTKNTARILAGMIFVIPLAMPHANGATIKNGVSCSKNGASAKITVKGVVQTYVCRVNPSIEGSTKLAWTLKSCITYWNTAQGSQKSINEQRALVENMSEPDRTNYLAELDKSQTSLNKVISTIRANYCKNGL